MIDRPYFMQRLREAIKRSPVTALLGPRQCGKTTLARLLTRERPAVFFDLESAIDRSRLQNSDLALRSSKGLVVLDEIQTEPALFNVLRVLVDRPDNRAKFLILGSAAPQLVKRMSETLAGRVEFIELTPFAVNEIGGQSFDKLWLRGGFPRSFLAKNQRDSVSWREGFIRTFLERDIPQLGISIPESAMRRFWTMLAHLHGQVWNASEIGRSLGFSDKTVRSYLDILTGTYMIRQLQPWFENIGKRQVKAPKFYFRDSGILHNLMRVDDWDALQNHYRLGASWEGFALEQFIRIAHPGEVFFWKTHSGAEIDLLYFQAGKRFGVEIKYNEAPRMTKSLHAALNDLSLERAFIIYPGRESYSVHERVTAVPLSRLAAVDWVKAGTKNFSL